jgi:hypothetical protein
MDYFHQNLIEIAQDLQTLDDEFHMNSNENNDNDHKIHDYRVIMTPPPTQSALQDCCDENYDDDQYDSNSSGSTTCTNSTCTNSNSSDLSQIGSLTMLPKQTWDDDYYRPEDVHSLMSGYFSHYYHSQQATYLQHWQRKFQPVNDQIKHDP